MSFLVVDAETYLYRSAVGAEYQIEWQKDQWTYVCDHAKARDSFTQAIDSLQDLAPTRCHSLFLCFGGKTNFRYGVLPSYKGNRRNQRRPAGYSKLIAWACATWDYFALPNVEGDDVVGLLACPEGKDVIASMDKDLQTIPGFHLLEGKVQEITPAQADLAFFTQVLTGDAADGYAGCPGVGKVTAERILSPCSSDREMWEAVVAAYAKAGISEEEALVQAQVARILRPGEYDHHKSSPSLWRPPVACD